MTQINKWEERFDRYYDNCELNGYGDDRVQMKQFIQEQILLAKAEGAAEERKRIVETLEKIPFEKEETNLSYKAFVGVQKHYINKLNTN